jgi:hypothetical protein
MAPETIALPGELLGGIRISGGHVGRAQAARGYACNERGDETTVTHDGLLGMLDCMIEAGWCSRHEAKRRSLRGSRAVLL